MGRKPIKYDKKMKCSQCGKVIEEYNESERKIIRAYVNICSACFKDMEFR